MSDVTLGLRIRVNDDGSVHVLNQTSAALDHVAGSASHASTASSAMNANMVASTAALRDTTAAAASTGSGFVALRGAIAGIGLGVLAKEMLNTIEQVQNLDTRLTSLTKSAQDYTATQAYLLEVSREHHKNNLDLQASFASLLTIEQTGIITRQQSQGILEGLSNAQSKTGATSEALKQSLVGTTQALGMGTVAWEEMKQITEPIPGLLMKIAEAAGYTGKTAVGDFKKVVGEAKVSSEMLGRILPAAFAKYDGAASATSDNLTAKYADVKNAWTDLAKVLEAPVNDALTPILRFATWQLGEFAKQANYLKSLFGSDVTSGAPDNGMAIDLAGRAKPPMVVDAAVEEAKKIRQEIEANDKKSTESANKKIKDAQRTAEAIIKAIQSEITAQDEQLKKLTLTDRAYKEHQLTLLGMSDAVKKAELNKYDLIKATEAEIEALKRLNAAQDESLKQQYALESIALDTQFAQKDLQMAKTLAGMGAENDYIKERIDLERKVRELQIANPSLSENAIRNTVTAQQKAIDELGKYTNAKTDESAKWMQHAYEQAVKNIQTDFANMFENMLNGPALDSFKQFADNIRTTLNKAISQQLAFDLQNLFSGNGSVINALKSGVLFLAAAIPSLFGKTQSSRSLSPSETGNSTVLGTGAMHIADAFARDEAFAYQSKAIITFNNNLDFLSTQLKANAGRITDWITSFGSKLSSISVFNQVASFFKPLTNLISDATAYVTSFVNTAMTAVTNFVGLTTTATSTVIDAVSSGAAGIGTAQDAAGTSVASNTGGLISGESAAKLAMVLAVMKLGYDLYSTWSDGSLTVLTKIGNSLEAASSAALAIGVYAWPALIVAGVLHIGAAITDIVENKLNVRNLSSLLGGQLGKILADWFMPARTPNAWMNTYNPNQSGGVYQADLNAPTYTATGNKSAYVGEQTPFGMTVISTHELSLSAQDMVNAFGSLLKTVKTVDTNLYNTINRLDAAMGQTGRTMDFYNHLLKDGNPGVTSVSTRQETESLNSGNMLSDRYGWIVNQLAASGSVVGQYINAWFDVITNKFISVSQDNSMFVLGVIDSLGKNIETFMQFPLALVNLIGQSVKAVNTGGTPASVMTEINDVFNTYMLVQNGLYNLGMGGDQMAINNSIVTFLANVNAIGFAVKDAGINLLAYVIAMQKTGTYSNDALAVLADAHAKFANLKAQGLDNSQITAYIGSFGQMAGLFAEAKVFFTGNDLDVAAQNIHQLAQASVDVARNTVDHAIATANLANVTRESAIATLVKNKTLDEATVAESEYGVSIQTVTKTVLEQMAFIQQVGFITGKTLGDMGVSADTWQKAANNIINVFGDLKTAMTTFDGIAKTFLSSTDYAQYNLDTISRGIANLQDLNPSLAGIGEKEISAALKSSDVMAAFITNMAQGNGDLAKTSIEYVQLIAQRITAEKALSDEVTKTTQAIKDAADKITKDLADKLTNAKNDLSTAYKREADALSATIKKTDDFIKTISQFKDSLSVGDLAPSSPLDKLNAITGQYSANLAIIKAGAGTTDASKATWEDAVGKHQGLASSLLTMNRDFYASSSAYTAAYKRVMGDTNGILSNLAATKTDAQNQLDKLDTAVGQLININDSVVSVHDAILALGVAWTATFKDELANNPNSLLALTLPSDFYTSIAGRFNEIASMVNGSHASGLSRVPFDGYVAKLHKDERVLTAEESANYHPGLQRLIINMDTPAPSPSTTPTNAEKQLIEQLKQTNKELVDQNKHLAETVRVLKMAFPKLIEQNNDQNDSLNAIERYTRKAVR